MEADAGNEALSSAPASDVVGDVPFGPPGASESGDEDEDKDEAAPRLAERLAAAGGLKADDGDEKVAAPDACGDAGRSDSGAISGRMAAGETTRLAVACEASEETEPVGDTDEVRLFAAPYVLLPGSDANEAECDAEVEDDVEAEPSAAMPAATVAGGGGDSARTPPAAATAAEPVK
jgi:hypothetical protein